MNWSADIRSHGGTRPSSVLWLFGLGHGRPLEDRQYQQRGTLYTNISHVQRILRYATSRSMFSVYSYVKRQKSILSKSGCFEHSRSGSLGVIIQLHSVIFLIGASRSEPHTSALIDFRFACLLVGWLVGLLVPYGHLTKNEVARRLRA